MSKYKDIRQDFWRCAFEAALPYEKYLAASDPGHAEKWRAMAGKVSLSEARRPLVQDFRRKMNVLVHSGVWCGDCVRQGPMLQAIAAENPLIDLRFSEKQDDSPITDELRINGATKVPVVVFLSEDFFELGRFGDRLLTVYRRMARDQVGAVCSTGLVAPPQDEAAAEIGEWVDIFERMHIILLLSPLLKERYGDG